MVIEENAMAHTTAVEEQTQLITRHRFTVKDFLKMGEAGILAENARVELIEGDVVDMAPIGSGHAGRVNLLIHFLSRAIGDAAIVSPQNPIILSEYSEPQPDVTLLKPRADFYTRSHPEPDDVLLLIEVADSSVRYDRFVKIPLYARYGLREVWLLDLPQKRLEAYRGLRPDHTGYESVTHYHDGSVSPEALPDVVLNIADLLLA